MFLHKYVVEVDSRTMDHTCHL